MKESRESLHDEKDRDSQHGKEGKNDKKDCSPYVALPLQGYSHHHLPKHLGQLCRETSIAHIYYCKWLMIESRWYFFFLTFWPASQDMYKAISSCWVCCVSGCHTDVRVPSWGPTVADMRRCWRCSPGSTQWCGWLGSLIRRPCLAPVGKQWINSHI